MTAAGELAMFLAIGAAAVGFLFGPIGSALARRLGGRSDLSEIRNDIEEVRTVTAEVDDLRNRLAEVEERLDFAERLLTHEGQVDQLSGRAQR
jgi:hypothetical protein